jgi:nitric oxide reductase activation protein
VSEYDPPFVDSTDSIKINSDLRLRRAISRLGLTYERHDRQSDGDGLSVDSLVQLAVSRALGEPGDDRIYEARLRTAHDLGVLVLLDSSGSTDERTTQGLLVWEAQRQLAANLVSILEEVGARVAAFGFNSQGRHIRFLRIKDFDDRFDQTSRRRLLAIGPTGLTRLGGAIRHGSNIVATRAGTQNLLLVLVSDGFPYENDEYQGSYAEHDTLRALEEAVAGGIGCACVAVASSTGDEALERLWGTIPHARLLHADHFGKYAEPLLRSAIQRADRRARTQSNIADR